MSKRYHFWQILSLGLNNNKTKQLKEHKELKEKYEKLLLQEKADKKSFRKPIKCSD